jgi:hypothetical protein
MTTLRIFLSYAPTDASFAIQLTIDLHEAGVEVIKERTDLDDMAFEEFVAQELPQCQHLIVVQTPEALQSPRVRAVVESALRRMQAGQMIGVSRVIAPTLNGVGAGVVPQTWANTAEFDASQDYPRALARLCLHLGLGTNDDHDAPPPVSSKPPLVLPDPNEIGKKSAGAPLQAQMPDGIDHPSRPHKYPPDPNGMEKKLPVAGPLYIQRSAGEDRPLRALRYPHMQLRRRLFLLSLAMVLVLVVAGVTVFISRNLTHGQSLPSTSRSASTPTSIATTHTPIPTATQQQPQPTPTPTPQPTPTPTPTPTPQPPTPTPTTTPHIANTLPIPLVHCTSTGQFCTPPFETPPIKTNSLLQIEYLVTHACSSIRLHIFVDAKEVRVTEFLGWPGEPLPLSTGILDLRPVASGQHVLAVEAEGRSGGCNYGHLSFWEGTLLIYTL